MKKLCTILIASLSLMCSGFGLVYAQTPVCDEFDGSTINTSMWNLVNDDWTLSNGQITGHWDIGCAHCDQANLVLQNAVQPTGDYTFETDMVYEPGKYGHRVVLYNSAGNKYNIIYDVSQKNFIIEVKQEGANYVPVIPFITNLTYNNTSGAINRAKIVKSGNEYACYLNDQYLSTLIDTRWSGDLRIGLGSYGTAVYERACITSGSQPQGQTCDEFDGSTINTSMWNPASGTWTQSGGRITGYWSLSSAHGEQGDLILTDAVQPTGDYTFEADMVNTSASGQGSPRINLYNSAGNKYTIVFESWSRGVTTALKQNGGSFQSLDPLGYYATNIAAFQTGAGVINTAKIVKHDNNQFTVYINDVELFTIVDNIWNGDVNIGLGAYGYSTYERACITTDEQQQEEKNILIYSTQNMYGNAILRTDFDEDLPSILASEGFTMTVEDRGSVSEITSDLLSQYDQLWFVSGTNSEILSDDEVQAILDFQAAGHGLLVISDGCMYSTPANQFSPDLGVTFGGSCCDCDHCWGSVGCDISASIFPIHEIWNGVASIQANQNEGDFDAAAPAEVIAVHNGISMVAVRDDVGGRVAWDATIYRFYDASSHTDVNILQADNAQYVKNLANWLADGGVPEALPPPDLVAPMNSAMTTIRPRFEWTPVPGADRYRLEVSSDINFNSLVVDMYPSGSATYQVSTPLLLGLQYWWRMATYDGQDWSAYSPVWSFNTELVTLSGTVLDQSSEMSGVTITAVNQGTDVKYSTESGQTVSSGHYFMDIPRGTYKVAASKIGYEFSLQEPTIIDEDKTINFEVTWPLPNKVRVHVRAAQFNIAVSGAQVELKIVGPNSLFELSGGTYNDVTGLEGSATFNSDQCESCMNAFPQILHIGVTCDGYLPTRVVAIPRPNSAPMEVNVDLVPVSDLSNNPVVYQNPYLTEHFSISYTTTSGSDNTVFEADHVVPIYEMHQQQLVLRKVPVFIHESGKYFEYALSSYEALGFAHTSDLGSAFPVIVRSSDILLPAGHHVSKYAQLLGLGRQIVVSTDWLTNSNWQNMYFNLRIASAHELFHAIEDFYNPLHFVASDPGRPEGCRGTWLIEGLAQWAAGAIHHDRFTSMADMLSLTRRANGLIFDSNSPNWTGKWSPIGCEESEYYGVSPVFWTFFAEQLGTDVYINGLDGSTVIVRGADIVEELLGNWASSILYPRPLSLTNDIVKNHRTWWPTTATIDNFFLNWFEANAVKDYVSQSPQNLDWSLYLYSSFVPGDARCAIVYDKVPVFTQTLSLPIQYTETVPSTMARYSCAYYDLTPPPLTSKLSIYPVWDDHGTLKLIPAIWPVVIPFGESGPLDYPVPLDASTQSSEKVPSDNCFDLSSYQGITRLVVLLPNYGGSFQGSRLVVRSSISDCCPLSFLTSCPVDLAVTDPSGRAISKQSNDVENAFYGESFLPGDSADVYDRVILLQALPGLYQIRILPDSTARPDDLFSVRCVQQGEVVPIALNVRIGDIPAQGYVFNTLPFASLTGPVKSETGVGLTAVPLDIYDNLGNLWQSVVTDDSGFYHVDSIPNGDYTISVVTPLGYQADEETKEFTINHVPVTVDFTLTKLDVTARPRTRAWWANQLHRALANCPADYNRAAFARFAGLINQHFNQNAINPVDFYSVPQPATQQDSLNFLKQLLNLMPCGQDEPFLQRLGKGQLIALMLNVVSGKIHQMQEISSDGSSVSQAITYCDMLVNDEIDPPNDGGPGCGQQFFRYLRADFILTLINLGLKVPAGMIPADVIEIAYKLHVGETMPAEFALQQNYPNPFNPLTDIRFSLPEPARVRLDVYDILGRNVATLIDESLEAGEHIVQWDGRNVGGRDVASGIYFYRIVTKDFVETKKMVLIR